MTTFKDRKTAFTMEQKNNFIPLNFVIKLSK